MLKQYEHDIVVGLKPEAEYMERTLYLEAGDKLFLFTDGVPEAVGPRDEMLGIERMTEGLNLVSELSGEKLLSGMRDYVKDFAGGAPRFDDATMLLFEIGKEEE